LRAIDAGLVNAVRVIPLDSPPPLILAPVGPDPFADLDATEANSAPEPELAVGLPTDEPTQPRGGFPRWALVGVVLLAVAGIVGAVVSQMGKKPPEVVKEEPPVNPLPKPNIAPAGKTVNLLAMVDPARDTVSGRWRMDGGKLVGGGTTPFDPQQEKLQVPYAPPNEYDMALVVERLGGEQRAFAIMGADPGRFLAAFDWTVEPVPVNGLEAIDGKLSNANETTTRGDFFGAKGGPIRIELQVRSGSVVVRMDGTERIRWKGDFNRLSRPDWWALPDPTRVGIGVLCGEYRIHEWTVTPIEGVLSVPADPSFFNGKDLTGWEYDPKMWTVTNGEIVAKRPAGKGGWQRLTYPRPLGDFELSFEALAQTLPDKVSSTLSFRGLDVQNGGILDLTGSCALWHNKGGKWTPPTSADAKLVEKLFVRDGYNRYFVRVVGRKATVFLNGTRVNEAEFPNMADRGQINWALYPEFDDLRLRNLRLVELPPPDPTFFNGKDLTGWDGDPKRWTVENGELVGTNSDKAGLRLTSTQRYRDFELTFEARVRESAPNNMSLFCFRKVHDGAPFGVVGLDHQLGIVWNGGGRGKPGPPPRTR